MYNKHMNEKEILRREKISNAMKGRNITWGNKISLAKIGQKLKDKPLYSSIHSYILRKFGKASYCSFNPNHICKKYDWANISGSYIRNIDDWTQLCRTCHMSYDAIKRGGVFPWQKRYQI